jgi:hypothetical protein
MVPMGWPFKLMPLGEKAAIAPFPSALTSSSLNALKNGKRIFSR